MRDAHWKFPGECVDHWWHPLGDPEAAPDVFLGFSHGFAQTGHWNSCLCHYPQEAFTLYTQQLQKKNNKQKNVVIGENINSKWTDLVIFERNLWQTVKYLKTYLPIKKKSLCLTEWSKIIEEDILYLCKTKQMRFAIKSLIPVLQWWSVSVMDDVNHQILSVLISPACFSIDLFSVSWSNLSWGD